MINVFSKLEFQREEAALLRETDGRSEGVILISLKNNGRLRLNCKDRNMATGERLMHWLAPSKRIGNKSTRYTNKHGGVIAAGKVDVK